MRWTSLGPLALISFASALRSYQQDIDPTTPLGEFSFNVISAFGQLEGSLISERVKAGMAATADRQGSFTG